MADIVPGRIELAAEPREHKAYLSAYRHFAFAFVLISAGCSAAALGVSVDDGCLGGLNVKTKTGWGAAITFGVTVQILFATYLKRRLMAEQGGYRLVGLYNGAFKGGMPGMPNLFAEENFMRLLAFVLHIVCVITMIAFLYEQPKRGEIHCDSVTTDVVLILAFVSWGACFLTELVAAAMEDPEPDVAITIHSNQSVPYQAYGHGLLAGCLLVNFGITITRVNHAHDKLANCSGHVHMYLAVLLFLSIVALVTLVTNYAPLNRDLVHARPWKYNVVPYLSTLIIGVIIFITYIDYEKNGITCVVNGDHVEVEEDSLKAQFWLMFTVVIGAPLVLAFMRKNKLGGVHEHSEEKTAAQRGEEQTYHTVSQHPARRVSAGIRSNRLDSGKPNTSVKALQFV